MEYHLILHNKEVLIKMINQRTEEEIYQKERDSDKMFENVFVNDIEDNIEVNEINALEEFLFESDLEGSLNFMESSETDDFSLHLLQHRTLSVQHVQVLFLQKLLPYIQFV